MLKVFVNFTISLFLFAFPLFSAEIILQNGDVLISEIEEDTTEFLVLKWNPDKLKIPQSEILSIDKNISGKTQYYPSSQVYLKDGSLLQGVISQETTTHTTIKTSLGFIRLDNSKIRNISKKSGTTLEKFIYKPHSSNTLLGVFGNFQKISPEVGGNNQLSFARAVGLFIEPEAFQRNENSRFGILSEYLSTGNRNSEELSFYNTSIYHNFHWNLQENWDFYFLLGGGISYTRFVSSEASSASINGNIFGQVGIQTTFNKYFIRVGYKLNSVIERKDNLLIHGLEISIGHTL